MSDEFTIRSVGDPREWRSEKFGGTFLAYPVDLEDVEGVKHCGVEWSRKPESRAPQVGERVAGHIQGGQHGDRFKLDFNATKELSGGTSSAGGGNHGARSGGGGWKPESQYDPEKTARIGRAHAQHMALRLLAINEPAPSSSKQIVPADVFALADEFQADVDAAAKAASGAGGVAPPAGPAAAGSASMGAPPGALTPAPPQASDEQGVHERIQTLLEANGVNWAVAQSLKDFAMTDLQPEKQDEVVAALQSTERKDKCTAWLLGEYQKVKGSLPEAKDDGEDIPF